MITRRSILRLSASSALAMSLQRECFAQAAVSGQTALRAADIASLDYPTVQTLFFIDRALRKASGGDLSIRVFPDAQLGQETEVIEQLRIGAIDMARVNVMSLASVVPELAVLGLPGVFLSDAHFDNFTEGPAGQAFLEQLESKGFVGLTLLEGGTRHLYNRVRPVEKVEDMQGLRLRTDLSSASGFLYRALGTTGVQLPLSHVLPALEARLVDGAIENIPTYVTLGHYRVAPFIAMTEMGRPPDILLIAQRAWNGLTPGQRELLKNASGDARRFMKKSFEYWSRVCLQQIQDRDVMQTHPDALVQPARGAMDAMLAQLDMMKWFELVRSAR